MAKRRMPNLAGAFTNIYGWSVSEKVISGHPMVQGPCYYFTEPITEYYNDSAVEGMHCVVSESRCCGAAQRVNTTYCQPQTTQGACEAAHEDCVWRTTFGSTLVRLLEGTEVTCELDKFTFAELDDVSSYQQQFDEAGKFCSTGYACKFLIGAPTGFDSIMLNRKGSKAPGVTVLAPSAGSESMTPYECKTAVEDVIALAGIEVFAWTTDLTGGPCVYYTKQLNYSSTAQFDTGHFTTNPSYPKYLATCEMDANVGASWCTTGRRRRFYQGYPSGDHVVEVDCNDCSGLHC